MMYLILIANCLSMCIGFYLVYDGQFLVGIVCFLVSFVGFRQLSIELDKVPQKLEKPKKIKPKKIKPKTPEMKMSIEAQKRLDKFSIN